LNDWEAVKAMIMTGHKAAASSAALLYEDRAFLASQSGTALLDKFTHCLVPIR
jgi:E3 ubiquitin-protein ligase EDD1